MSRAWSGLRHGAAALLLCCCSLVQAHSGPGDAVQAELGAQAAVWDDVTVQVRRSLAPQILLANPADKTIEILDQHGVAFVRIAPQGVFANVTAAAWYNTYSTAGLSVPAKAHDPAAVPQWQQVSADAQWGWFDPRLDSSEVEPPEQAVAQSRSESFGAWQIPARIDGQPAFIHGHYRYTPPQAQRRQARLQSSGQAESGVLVQLIPGPVDAFMLQNRSDAVVTVLGLQGEPFLKIGPQAVLANSASPTWREWGRVELAVDNTAAAEQWQRVAGGTTFTWLDPRTQISDTQESAVTWRIPLRVGATPLALLGSSEWIAPPAPPQSEHQAHDMAMMHHDHASMAGIEAAEPIPSLRVEAIPDEVSGWNIHIMVDNFRFAPEHVNQAHRDGEGHAHLYLDGEKIARVYGPWYHLSVAGDAKTYELKVELNANTHAGLLHKQQPISATVELTRP